MSRKADELLALTSGVRARELPATESKAPRSAPAQFMLATTRMEEAEAKVEELQEKLDKMPLRELKLDELVEEPGRRRKLTKLEYANLRENLKAHPLVNPIVVAPRPDGRFTIISGHNRVAIYRELARPSIVCKIDEASKVQQEIAAFYANLFQSELPAFEKYKGFRTLQEGSPETIRSIAEKSGLSKSTVGEIMNYDKLPAEVMPMLSSNPHCLGVKAANQLAKATEKGFGQQVIAAIKRLATDSRFNERMAVAAVIEAMPNPPQSQVSTKRNVTVRGSERYCSIDVKKGSVIIDFADKNLAPQWLAKFEEFMKNTLKAEEK